MTTLDEFLMEESKRQISQFEKTFETIIKGIVDNFTRQITKDPFKDTYTVHVVRADEVPANLDHLVKHGQDQKKFLFYLMHYGIAKISAYATISANLDIDRVIRVTLINHTTR